MMFVILVAMVIPIDFGMCMILMNVTTFVILANLKDVAIIMNLNIV